jgi:hypothetical protein
LQEGQEAKEVAAQETERVRRAVCAAWQARCADVQQV